MISLSDSQKIGMGLTGFGVFFLFFGMMLFFDKALLAIGNILFVSGLSFVIGLERTFRFFFQKHKAKATGFFLGGIFVVLTGWPIIGVVLEIYGFFLLFRSRQNGDETNPHHTLHVFPTHTFPGMRFIGDSSRWRSDSSGECQCSDLCSVYQELGNWWTKSERATRWYNTTLLTQQGLFHYLSWIVIVIVYSNPRHSRNVSFKHFSAENTKMRL